ncbi:MAG: response regulator [Magnetococcales bacterium]|nr:response regulator [Magnetococcales bacterium]
MISPTFSSAVPKRDPLAKGRELGKQYEVGEFVYQKGERADCLFVLQSGRIELFTEIRECRRVLRVLRPGEMFGESALFTAKKKRLATAEVVEPSRVLKVDERTLMVQIHSNPSVLFRITRQMAERIRRLDRERSSILEAIPEEMIGTLEGSAPRLFPNPERPIRNVFNFGVGYHILLVEDDPDFHQLVRTRLEKMQNPNDGDGDTGTESGLIPFSFQLDWVTSRADALKKLKKEKYDVILLDLNLPDSRGMETFISIHNRHPDSAIVILSGVSNEAWAMRAVHGGAEDYLVKDKTDAEDLRHALRNAVERHRQQGHPVIDPRDLCRSVPGCIKKKSQQIVGKAIGTTGPYLPKRAWFQEILTDIKRWFCGCGRSSEQ